MYEKNNFNYCELLFEHHDFHQSNKINHLAYLYFIALNLFYAEEKKFALPDIFITILKL